MVSLNASMTLLNASAINTKAMRNPTAIHAVWDIFRKILSNMTRNATTNCILKFLSFLIMDIRPCIACFWLSKYVLEVVNESFIGMCI